MEKARLLRAAIAAALPEFTRDPDRLKIWVEDGSMRSRQTASLGVGFKYRLNVLLEEATTDIALVALAVFRWARVHQPDLLAAGSEGVSFEADVLDNQSADIQLTLELTDDVIATALPDGSVKLDYVAEPDPLFDDDLPFADLDHAPPLFEVRT